MLKRAAKLLRSVPSQIVLVWVLSLIVWLPIVIIGAQVNIESAVLFLLSLIIFSGTVGTMGIILDKD